MLAEELGELRRVLQVSIHAERKTKPLTDLSLIFKPVNQKRIVFVYYSELVAIVEPRLILLSVRV